MTEPLRILSLGGGTQSCALALMSARGDLPRLDAVVFADTQGEMPGTYAYLWWLAGELHTAGIPLHIASAGNLEAALLSTEPTSKNPTPPLHVLRPDGKKGRINNYRCSYDYKRRVISSVVKSLTGGRGAWKRANVEQWIGFSLDETKRMKQTDECRCGHNRLALRPGGTFHQIHTADGCTRCTCARFDPWQVNRWPLIELRMKRDDTIRWFPANGYPTPPRSACWFCPNSKNDRWQALATEAPHLFDRACTLDETIRNGGGFNRRGGSRFNGELYMHDSLVPLRSADLRTARELTLAAGQGELFDPDALAADCNTGTCFT